MREGERKGTVQSLSGIGDHWGMDEGWLESQASSCNCQGGKKGIMSLVPWLIKA